MVEKFLGTGAAAKYLGISIPTMYRLLAKNLLSPAKTPGGQRRFTLTELDEFMERSKSRAYAKNTEHKKMLDVILYFTENGADVLEIDPEKSLAPFLRGRKCARANPQILPDLSDGAFDMVLLPAVWTGGDYAEFLDRFVETAKECGRLLGKGKCLCVVAADRRAGGRLVCVHADIVTRLGQVFDLQAVRTLKDDRINGEYAVVFRKK